MSSPCEHQTAHSVSQLQDCHQCLLQRRVARSQLCELCSPLSLSPHSSDSSLHWGCSVQTPFSSADKLGDEFLPTAAPNHQSLHAASTPSLETAFSWKLTCLAKVAHCCCFKSELTATAINCHVFGQEPHLCTTSQLLQGLHTGGLEKLRGRPRGSWLQS